MSRISWDNIFKNPWKSGSEWRFLKREKNLFFVLLSLCSFALFNRQVLYLWRYLQYLQCTTSRNIPNCFTLKVHKRENLLALILNFLLFMVTDSKWLVSQTLFCHYLERVRFFRVYGVYADLKISCQVSEKIVLWNSHRTPLNFLK